MYKLKQESIENHKIERGYSRDNRLRDYIEEQ